MIYAFSTLGEGASSDASRFYRCVEEAMRPNPVCWVMIGDRFSDQSPSRIEIDWPLKSIPDTQSRECAIDLDVWIDRFAGDRKRRRREGTTEKIQRYANYIDDQFRKSPPSLVLVSSNSVPHTGIAFDLARKMGVPTAAFERGYLPQTFQISDYGSGPFSQWSDRALTELVTDANRSECATLGSIEFDRLKDSRGRRAPADDDDRPPTQETSRSKRIKTLFLPVADVSFSVYPIDHPDHARIMPAFRDSLHIAKLLRRSRSIDLVVKPHPTEAALKKWKRTLLFPLNVSHGDPIEWIRWADVVVCNGSTMDLVAVAMGKPVVLAGRSILSAKGIAAAEVGSAGELADAVRSAARFESDSNHRRRFCEFLGWLRSEHLLDCQDSLDEFRNRLMRQLRLSGIDVDRIR